MNQIDRAMWNKMCSKCGGIIPEQPMRGYGWAGRFCNCTSPEPIELVSRSSLIKQIEEMDGIRRGKWLIHPDWISRKAVLSLLKEKK